MILINKNIVVFKEDLTNLINNSNLPPAVVSVVLENAMLQTRVFADKAIATEVIEEEKEIKKRNMKQNAKPKEVEKNEHE